MDRVSLVEQTYVTHGRCLPIVDAETSYREGYESGLFWRWNDLPGGPFVFKHGSRTDTQALAIQSAYNFDAWHRGWRDGIKDANASGE